MVLKNFAVFEGLDGAGTSTQIRLLKARPEAASIFFTSEPNENAETGRFLRQILSGKTEVSPQTAAFLFAADRAEHLWGKNGIEENCRKGKLVISDRYLFSSLAYQGVTCGEEMPEAINSFFPLPEFLFFFDIKTGDSLKRIDRRGEKKEIYENREMLEATRLRYKNVLDRYRKQEYKDMHIIELDASLEKKTVAEQIWNVLKEKFNSAEFSPIIKE